MRDDSSLYTGITSATFEKVKAKRDEVRQQRSEERALFQRGSDVVIDRINDEIDLVPHKVWSLINADDTEENVKSKLIGLKFYTEYLNILKSELTSLLKKKAEVTEDE